MKHKFFFYGIFLNESTRESYNITSEPKYDTVLGYATFGHSIVQAAYIPNSKLSLTGIVVDVPESSIPSIDRLEGGYDRITVQTTRGQTCQMYVTPSRQRNAHDD